MTSNIGYMACKIVVIDHNNKYIITNNLDQLVDMIKNNKICEIDIYHDFYQIINCEELTELLKYNTSIDKISFRFLYNQDRTDFYSECCKLLFTIFITNKSVTHVELHDYYMTDDTFINIVNLLNMNNTIKTLEIKAKHINNKYVINLIKNNNTLKRIIIFTDFISKYPCRDQIIDAIKYNFSIISFYMDYQIKECKISKYCERNEHNILLKSLRLQDLKN